MSENNSLTVIDKKTVTNAQQILKGVTEQHTKVSQIETPKAYVYKKQGFDYVKLEYMRAIADKNFPGWSWTIINTEVLGSEAYVVHGRLKLAEKTNRYDDIQNGIEDGNIHGLNYKASLAKLERLAGGK